MAKRIPAVLHVTQVPVAVHAAATATETRVLFTAPTACKIAVGICPDVGSTGDNTNTTNLNLINKGTGGAGSTEIGNLDLVTGTNLVAFDERAIIAEGSEVTLAEGDVVALQFEKVATGLLVGPGNVNIRWWPL